MKLASRRGVILPPSAWEQFVRGSPIRRTARCLAKGITFWSITVYKLSICPLLLEEAHRFAGLCVSLFVAIYLSDTRAKFTSYANNIQTIFNITRESCKDRDYKRVGSYKPTYKLFFHVHRQLPSSPHLAHNALLETN